MKLNKSNLNLTIDIIMFMVLMVIAGIGFMIKYVLVPGFKRNEIYGKDVELYYWGLDRHQWGDIHLILGFIFLFLLLFHIIFHWKMIISIFKNMVSEKILRIVLTVLIIIVFVVFVVMPLFVKPEIQEGVPHYSHQKNNIDENLQSPVSSDQIKSRQLGDGIPDTITSNNSTKGISHNKTNQGKNYKQRELHTIEIYGSMTLNEVAAKYNIPATELASCIHVPKEYTNEKLGRLRKQYGFHMDDLRKYIESKNE